MLSLCQIKEVKDCFLVLMQYQHVQFYSPSLLAADSAFVPCYPAHKKVYFIYLYVFASREDLQLRAESAGSLVKRQASFPARHWNPVMFSLTGENSLLSLCHITLVSPPIFPCKQEAALLNIISIESKWCLCLISSGLRLYQQACCWSCICSLEYFKALEFDRFMFITLNHFIIDSPKCYSPSWKEAVGKKKKAATPLAQVLTKRPNPAAFI